MNELNVCLYIIRKVTFLMNLLFNIFLTQKKGERETETEIVKVAL
jgi:hypothetical protein